MLDKPSVQLIKETYSQGQLKEIVEHGCSTGCAEEHIYQSQTWEFFLSFEEEIEDYFYNLRGDEWLESMCNGESSVRGLVHQIVWSYIENIANIIVEAT